MFLNVCKQTFHISNVCISQKVKGVLMWNFQHIIFIWRRRYCQIFKSALVNIYSESIINGKTRKIFLELASLKMSGKFPRKSFVLIKTPFCKNLTLLKWIFLRVILRNLTNNAAAYFSGKLSLSVFTIWKAFQQMFLIWDKNTSLLYFKRLFT